MNFNTYLLEPETRSYDYLRWSESMHVATHLCKRDPSHAARAQRCNPLRVVLPGATTADIQWTSYLEPVVTPEVRQVLLDANLAGCRFESVVVENTLGEERSEKLYELRCTGWGGVAPPSSGIRLIEECPECKRRVFTGFKIPQELFDPDRWDGSDFFIIWPLSRYIFITDSVRELLNSYSFTGYKAIPIEKLRIPIAGRLGPDNILDLAFEPQDARVYEAQINKVIQMEYNCL